MRIPALGRFLSLVYWFAVLVFAAHGFGCGGGPTAVEVAATAATPISNALAANVSIEVASGGPADTVRVFYRYLREKKFRDAVFLTNLRPAVDGLTELELREFSLDFEKIAGRIPADIEINGEIISGSVATVTANLPADDEDKNEIQTIRLRNENGIWVILTVDPAAEDRIRKEGTRYFYNLKIETHQEEARNMLERVSRAQLAYSLQNGGNYGDLNALVTAGLLPDDIKTSASTGYNYTVQLLTGNKRFSAGATPAVYGKTGRLSYFLRQDEKGISHVSSKDEGEMLKDR